MEISFRVLNDDNTLICLMSLQIALPIGRRLTQRAEQAAAIGLKWKRFCDLAHFTGRLDDARLFLKPMP